jgi:acetyl-CoA carboxylase carboxyl transferase subunit alpha
MDLVKPGEPETPAETSKDKNKTPEIDESADSAMNRVLLARHDKRPYGLDWIERIFTGFCELHGDRKFGDDAAIVGGFAWLGDQPVVVIAQQKGRQMRERQQRNFGMPKPEGYRKALRLMKLGEKFGHPVITLIDTPGAFPGIDAEERGQAEAIAFNLREMSRLEVPIIVVVTGEGGSGGALAIGVGDRILMLENATYSVITPEGCAAILWKDKAAAPLAATSLKMTAPDLLDLGVIDVIVPEPASGAQEDWDGAAAILGARLKEELASLTGVTRETRREKRYQRFRKLGSMSGL